MKNCSMMPPQRAVVGFFFKILKGTKRIFSGGQIIKGVA